MFASLVLCPWPPGLLALASSLCATPSFPSFAPCLQAQQPRLGLFGLSSSSGLSLFTACFNFLVALERDDWSYFTLSSLALGCMYICSTQIHPSMSMSMSNCPCSSPASSQLCRSTHVLIASRSLSVVSPSFNSWMDFILCVSSSLLLAYS